jgi:membrane protein
MGSTVAGMRIRTRLKTIRTVVVKAAIRFDDERGFEAAAALAFYSVVSLFPLLLLLIAGASLVIEGQEAKTRVLETLFEFVPTVSQQLISRNIEQVLEQREGFSLLAVAVLMWSASGVFSGLLRNVNRAWSGSQLRNIVRNRFFALLMVFGLFLLLVALFLVQHAVNVMEDMRWASNPAVALLIPSSRLLTYSFGFLALLVLYRMVPTRHVKWRHAAVGAIASASAAELATAVYGVYLSQRLEQYNLVYGSLATMLGFMFWTYAVHAIVLFGAHLSAQAARRRPDA